ncbi:uncharacterized protein MONBRDRAFT_6242 [Monosiga brevicollis MX1]|uniref:P-type domain-containing protein n=1 Tax=Monosiga brevicollis TaxID=81824 RepID=A9UT89_MONBE|nr:uncharacterized protein MONBRDRAFT_6242 [Monosiga brevicollis MX1]EDQ91204.1 predicted protein [Monosiga brevicollis MX1]|eukprot:XP_001743626.1 hypothetical protein [Monosiga brevicollis MX1]
MGPPWFRGRDRRQLVLVWIWMVMWSPLSVGSFDLQEYNDCDQEEAFRNVSFYCHRAKIDCGDVYTEEDTCKQRGCIWQPGQENSWYPWCYHPSPSPCGRAFPLHPDTGHLYMLTGDAGDLAASALNLTCFDVPYKAHPAALGFVSYLIGV